MTCPPTRKYNPPPLVPDVSVNLAFLPWNEYVRSIGCWENPSEKNLKHSIFCNMINAVEKMLFFSGALGPQCQRAMKWSGFCHGKHRFNFGSHIGGADQSRYLA